MSTEKAIQRALEYVWARLPESALPDAEAWSSLVGQGASYWSLLARWNAKIKLTGAATPEQFASRHLADSLFGQALLGPLPDGARILDVGAGAGFPGVPLAILYADRDIQWDLAESHQRRCAFLGQLQRTLKLPQVHTHATRIAGHPDDEGLHAPYHRLLFRAVAPEQILPLASAYLHPDGEILYWGTQAEHPTPPEGLTQPESFAYELPSGEAFAIYRYRRLG